MSNSFAVIFDMDGVLVDSYVPHWKSWKQMADEQGWPLTEEAFRKTFGQTSREIIHAHWGHGVLSDDEILVFDRRKESLYREIVAEDFPAMAGAAGLIDALHRAGIRLAVGSSGPPENVALAVDKLGVRSKFQTLVTGADVKRGKPDPEVFLTAALRLGVEPSRCAVIEDSPVGLSAANAAKMTSIALLSTGHTRESVAHAQFIVESFHELNPERIVEWIGG